MVTAHAEKNFAWNLICQNISRLETIFFSCRIWNREVYFNLTNTSCFKVFLVFTHVMRRPCWCTKNGKMSLKFCIIIESNSQKTFYVIVLYTNMAPVTSRENRELRVRKDLPLQFRLYIYKACCVDSCRRSKLKDIRKQWKWNCIITNSFIIPVSRVPQLIVRITENASTALTAIEIARYLSLFWFSWVYRCMCQ